MISDLKPFTLNLMGAMLLQDKNSLDYIEYDHDDDHNLVFYEPEGGDDGGDPTEFWIDE